MILFLGGFICSRKINNASTKRYISQRTLAKGNRSEGDARGTLQRIAVPLVRAHDVVSSLAHSNPLIYSSPSCPQEIIGWTLRNNTLFPQRQLSRVWIDLVSEDSKEVVHVDASRCGVPYAVSRTRSNYTRETSRNRFRGGTYT